MALLSFAIAGWVLGDLGADLVLGEDDDEGLPGWLKLAVMFVVFVVTAAFALAWLSKAGVFAAVLPFAQGVGRFFERLTGDVVGIVKAFLPRGVA